MSNPPFVKPSSKVRGVGGVGLKLVFESGLSMMMVALVKPEKANLFCLRELWILLVGSLVSEQLWPRVGQGQGEGVACFWREFPGWPWARASPRWDGVVCLSGGW